MPIWKFCLDSFAESLCLAVFLAGLGVLLIGFGG